MTHPPFLRAKARELRITKRLTIDELAERLTLSRSTVYHWVRDIPIPASHRLVPSSEVGRRKGSRAMQRKYRLLRAAAYEEGTLSFADMASDASFRDFVCLYIAEGYKRSRHTVSLCNSDLAVVKVADKWIRALTRGTVRYGIQYHADQEPASLARFWGAELGIDPSGIKLQRKSNSNQLAHRSWRCEHGVLTVSAYDTLLRARLQGWMDCLRASWS